MRHKGRAEITTEELTAYLEGEVTPSEASKVEAKLRESPVTKRRLASLRHIRDALSQAMPEHRDLDLVPSLRQALAKAAPSTTAGRAAAWQVSRGWAAAAAGGVLLIGLSWVYRQPSSKFTQVSVPGSVATAPELEEFRAKSGHSAMATPNRWAGVRAFSVAREGKPERLTATTSAKAGLLFSYTNLGNNPFDYLMIFAVDAGRSVHWFYPAYERAGTNPASIPIKQGLADVPLPDLIHQDWSPGPLAIHALFSSQPLSVLEVEARIEQASSVLATREPLNVSDTLDQVTITELVP